MLLFGTFIYGGRHLESSLSLLPFGELEHAYLGIIRTPLQRPSKPSLRPRYFLLFPVMLRFQLSVVFNSFPDIHLLVPGFLLTAYDKCSCSAPSAVLKACSFFWGCSQWLLAMQLWLLGL